MRHALAAAMPLLFAGAVLAQSATAPGAALGGGLRGNAPLDVETRPPPLPKTVNDDQRRPRSYPAQPPVIPHQIDNYQVDLRFNKCMSCHGRERVGESQAPMVSVTHFMDREGNMRQEISPRRYFCTQCHVPQSEVRLPVRNEFIDFYKVPEGAKAGGKGAAK
jgi:cytochrome c-type protein NapB